ncbi:amidase family protein [Mycobacterium kansasii]|uniref:amidase n=1 Tax=Mycobacterium kansasii TaxID=1768 RepID=A0A1V3XJ98_MYCKA|nr:amidase family protein [Mycobacterium kansasii]
MHPEILAATRQVGEQLQLLGHTVVRGNPDYSVQMSWDFLARSTAGLWEWAQRLGDGVTLDPRTVSNLRTGHILSQAILRSARRHEAAAQRRVGSIFDIVDVVLAPTTAQPPPPARTFDQMGGLATDRAMIAACPYTWPWNLLGWPAINVPAGFTVEGLPIGVQLMGPANSEGMLISLAAELEAVSGWAAKQPAVWWDEGTDTPGPTASGRHSVSSTDPGAQRNARYDVGRSRRRVIATAPRWSGYRHDLLERWAASQSGARKP